jgi:L-rhamnose mutarotase
MMYSIGLALTLRPGAYDGYKRAHDELWPELAAGMRANQVSMSIYRDGNRLFVFAAAPSEADWERSRQDAVLARWDQEMTKFLETDSDGRLAFTQLPKAFGFGEFES